MTAVDTIPPHANACLILADGTVFFGEGIGSQNIINGEICFNTAMTGYQEVLTDPSYAGQIITFTFPHIGNTGCNDEDIEAQQTHCSGLVLRERPTLPSSFRSNISLQDWLNKNKITGICGIDTRALTRHIRAKGAQNAAIIYAQKLNQPLLDEARSKLEKAPSMKGQELAAKVSTDKAYEWTQGLWKLSSNSSPLTPHLHIVAVDYGAKHNILRSLAERGCKITVVNAKTSAEDILAMKPDGIFLSNGPGDPSATGEYSLPVIKQLIDSDLPIFGICLGHQLLALAMGAKTEKMAQGHRGVNHPVKNLSTDRVEITSQNHGFAVSKENMPDDIEITHLSLFDNTVQGIRHKTKPIFSVQGHPEASPGPHDSQYLFDEFVEAMETNSDASDKKVKAHA